MRIGVDATCWANERGYGRFTRELCSAMARRAPGDEFVFFADQRAAECFDLEGSNVTMQRVELDESPTQAASAHRHRSPFDMLKMTRAVKAVPLDVFFSPSVYTYFPVPRGLRTVVTIHDVIAERFPHLTLPSRKARLFWKAKVRFALWQANLVLTVSEFSRRDIARVLGVPLERIHVTMEAPAKSYRPSTADEIACARRRLELPDGLPWFVYVGGFNPHKNVDRLVGAIADMRTELGPERAPRLLLVGTIDGDVFHGDQARIHETIRACGCEDLVRWLGFVGDDELRHLHSGARALVLPSQCEGFGLPAVEAAACGTPVIATRESPLPELLKGGGVFIDPTDSGQLLGALRELATDDAKRAALGRVALERARSLDWTTGADAALTALREAVR